jgi:DNA-binding NtrC family response regulator
MKHVLVIDDERGARESVKAVFSGKHEVSTAPSAAEGLDVLGKKKVDLIFLDVMMPQQDGLSFLKEVHGIYPDLPVIMISACTSLRPVVEAMRVGAYDYIQKPFDVEELRNLASRALENTSLRHRIRTLESDVAREFPVEQIIGDAPPFAQALADARKAAAADSNVLILGETGTGKELVARMIHALSTRRDEPFVAVHCAALPETLMESELFGHEKGAFTGADRQKPGRFEMAGSGTLFFDEIGEMTASTQVRLLRVLQEKEYMRVGGTRVLRTEARVLAATSRDLRKEARAGRFRDDLYYRLSVVPVTLPALRQRPSDIPKLAMHFLDRARRTLGAATEGFEPEAMEALRRYSWPGNIRELKNIIERMLVLHGRDKAIRVQSLPEEFHAGANAPAGNGPASAPRLPCNYRACVDGYERGLIEEALRQTDGIQTKAAKLLGTTRRILRYRMETLKIAFPQTPPNGNSKT